MNDEAVYRTAPATPGLLNTQVLKKYNMAAKKSKFNRKSLETHFATAYPQKC